MGKTEKSKESWQERRKKIKHKCAVPFIFVEWICERLSYALERWAFLDILGHAGRLAILLAVVSYFMGADERRMQAESQRKAKHYQAWQVINSAQGKTGSGGRIDALQDLNRDKVSLAYVDISKAWLPGLNLENAILYRADFNEVTLGGANLSAANLHSATFIKADLNSANLAGAIFMWAKLTGASLTGADLAGADLRHADFNEVTIGGANLSGANLHSATFIKADLNSANLTGAIFMWANLADANLAEANLAGADLRHADLKDIKNWKKIKSIENANIFEVTSAPEGFLEWAKDRGAVHAKTEDEWKKLICEKMEEENKRKEGRSSKEQKR